MSESRLNNVLTGFAIAYLVIFGALAVFFFLGFAFVSTSVFPFLNTMSIIMFFPALIALYVNRDKRWAKWSLMLAPIAALSLPMPSVFLWKGVIIIMVVPAFFLPGSYRGARGIMGSIVAVFGIMIVSVFVLGSWMDMDLQEYERVVISTSPNNKYVIEAIGSTAGGPYQSPTEVSLYHNHMGYPIKRRIRILARRDDWPGEVEIKWLDNKHVMIEEELFNINK